MKNCISITYSNKANKSQLVKIALALFLGYFIVSFKIPKVDIKNRKSRFAEFNKYLISAEARWRFSKSWDELVSRKYDFKRLEGDCYQRFTWTKSEAIPWHQHQNRTEYTKGYFNIWNINKADEFSSITLQTQYQNGSRKLYGGDHWRVRMKGPSSPHVIKTDLRNGSYEFKFLPVVPGSYQLFVWLEYTLCAGLKEPPSDWFIRGDFFQSTMFL